VSFIASPKLLNVGISFFGPLCRLTMVTCAMFGPYSSLYRCI